MVRYAPGDGKQIVVWPGRGQGIWLPVGGISRRAYDPAPALRASCSRPPAIFSGMEEAGNIKVLFFGAAADRAGTRVAELQTGETTLDGLWPLLAERYPGLSPMRKTLAFAVNEEYAGGDTPVRPGDEVAVLPPVSGG